MRRLTLALITITLLFGLMPTPAQALTYPQVILADTPVHYYRLNETSGTSAADSAFGSPATYQLFPTFSRTGAIYDGDAAIGATLGQINTGLIYSGYGAVNHTIGCEVWFKIYSAGAAVNATRYLCLIIAPSENMWIRVGLNSLGVPGLNILHTSNSVPSTVVTFDTWHHVYMQYDNTTRYMSLYYDGILISQAADSAFATANATIRWGTGAGNLQIDLDEAALYEHTLTPAQVLWHYQNGFSAVATPTPTTTSTPLITYTPSITFTPTDTPTSTVTPTLTPGWDYEIPLPSGRTAAVRMEATAGDITVVMFIVFAVAIMLLTVYLRRRSNGS